MQAAADETEEDSRELSLPWCLLDAPHHLGDGPSCVATVAGVAEQCIGLGEHIPIRGDALELFCQSRFDYLSRLQS